MSKRGNETPRKSRRLNDEASSEEFHAPSFKILLQTQTQPSSAKDKSRTGKSKIKKKQTNIQRKSRKGKEKQKVDESEKRAKERGKKRKGKQIEYSLDSKSDFVEEFIKSKSKKSRASEIDTSHLEEEETVKPKKI